MSLIDSIFATVNLNDLEKMINKPKPIDKLSKTHIDSIIDDPTIPSSEKKAVSIYSFNINPIPIQNKPI